MFIFVYMRFIVGRPAPGGVSDKTGYGSVHCSKRKPILCVILFAVKSRISLCLSQICFGSLDCKCTTVFFFIMRLLFSAYHMYFECLSSMYKLLSYIIHVWPESYVHVHVICPNDILIL